MSRWRAARTVSSSPLWRHKRLQRGRKLTRYYGWISHRWSWRRLLARRDVDHRWSSSLLVITIGGSTKLQEGVDWTDIDVFPNSQAEDTPFSTGTPASNTEEQTGSGKRARWLLLPPSSIFALWRKKGALKLSKITQLLLNTVFSDSVFAIFLLIVYQHVLYWYELYFILK